ncbi:MAG: zinc ABC transporter substrate-binding protein [Phycisphaeraceae bacterium]|nr:zinc ABC transporter substrate-binding protein [Phycisphaeraceae bacterium]
MHTSLRSAAIALCLALAACGGNETPRSAPRNASNDAPPPAWATPTVMTTFYPTLYFAQRIGGESVSVSCPVPEDEDAIFWQPDDRQIAAYQRADMIIINGAEFEKWVATVSLPDSHIVNSAAALPDPLITFEAVTHSHGLGGAHTHEGIDGHTWVDPVNARLQAQAIRDAMIARWPDRAAAFRSSFDTLARDLNALDTRIKEITPRLAGVVILCSHPAYNYLARRQGWTIINLALDPEAELDQEARSAISHALEGAPQGAPRLLLWESEPLSATSQSLQSDFDVQSVVFSPCELLGETDQLAGADYLSVMRDNIDRLESALD